MDRRHVFRTVLTLSLVGCLSPRAAFAQEKEELTVEWRVAPDQEAAVAAAMPVKKAESYDQRNPLLVGAVILIGASLVPKIIQAIVDVFYRYHSGGVIIDARTQPVTITTNPRIAPGFALVISADGAKTVQLGGTQPISAEDYKSMADVLKSAITKG